MKLIQQQLWVYLGIILHNSRVTVDLFQSMQIVSKFGKIIHLLHFIFFSYLDFLLWPIRVLKLFLSANVFRTAGWIWLIFAQSIRLNNQQTFYCFISSWLKLLYVIKLNYLFRNWTWIRYFHSCIGFENNSNYQWHYGFLYYPSLTVNDVMLHQL